MNYGVLLKLCILHCVTKKGHHVTLRLRKGILLIDPGHDFVILRIFYGEASPFLDSDISPAEVVVAVADTGLADRRRGMGGGGVGEDVPRLLTNLHTITHSPSGSERSNTRCE